VAGAQRMSPHQTHGAWQPGDVIDQAGHLWIRASHPLWVWGYPDEGHPGYIPAGSIEESDVQRPLTLLVRDARPVHTVVVADT
jgi:hypothetical protein